MGRNSGEQPHHGSAKPPDGRVRLGEPAADHEVSLFINHRLYQRRNCARNVLAVPVALDYEIVTMLDGIAKSATQSTTDAQIDR